MIRGKLMWSTIFNNFSHPCTVVDVLSEVWTGVFINMLFDEVTIGVRADVKVIVLPDAVTDLEFTVSLLVNIDMLAWSGWFIGVDLSNVLTGVTTVVEFTMSESLEKWVIFDWAAFTGWPMVGLGCHRVLQAWIPSYHVWSSLELPALPQFPNQEPSRPQQLSFPDFLAVPHLGHAKPIAVVVTARVYM